MQIPNRILSKLTNEELVRLSADSQQAYSELIARFMSYILHRISKYNLPTVDKDDLVQECLIGFVKAVKTFDSSKGVFVPYAKRCIDTSVVTAVSKALSSGSPATVSCDSIEDYTSILESTYVSPEEIVSVREQLKELISTAKELLSPMELSVLDGRLLGLSYAEIALRLSITPKQVDNAYQRIRGKLRRLYSE